MTRMLATIQRNKINRCCSHCTFRDGQYMHGGRKSARFRKWARSRDKASWKREEL